MERIQQAAKTPPSDVRVGRAADRPRATARAHPVLRLQSRIGNRAAGSVLQAKLRVSRPDDVYEREADRVADDVMRMPDSGARAPVRRLAISSIQRRCPECEREEARRAPEDLVQRLCPECEKERAAQRQAESLEEEEETPAPEARLSAIVQREHRTPPEERRPLIHHEEEDEDRGPSPSPLMQRQEKEESEEEPPLAQANPAGASTPNVPPSVESSIHASGGRGTAMSRDSRDFFESRFGSDFSSVRIHADSSSAAAARQLRARAFTVGNDVFFGAGEYRPETSDGRRLLAHELTHVVQQSEGSGAQREVIRRFSILDTLGDVAGAAGDIVREGAGRVAEGARAVGGTVVEGARAVGGAVVEGAGVVGSTAVSLGRGAVEAAVGIGRAAVECARASGRSLRNIVTLDVDSLYDLIGVPQPTGDGPAPLDGILAVLRHPCLQMIPGYSLLARQISRMEPLQNFLKGAWQIMQDPSAVIEAIKSSIGGMIAQVPDLARAITRRAVTFSEPLTEHLEGICRHLIPKLDYLAENWWEVLKQTGWDLLWPWPGVWKDLKAIWKHIKSAADHVWDLEFGAAVDDLLAIWRTANVALGRLYGWFFIASVLVGAIIGAFFGGAGAIPGAAAGAKFAVDVGMGLLVSTVAAEAASIGKAGLDLAFADQSDEEQEEDYEQIATSGITLAITGVMFALGALAARFARGVISRVAGRVWRRPARRGRRGTGPSRGDVIEVRVLQSQRVLGVLRRRAVTWLEVIRRNFPVIDLVDGGTIRIVPRTGRAPLYQVHGGRIISVKSTIQIGRRGVTQIQRWIRELAGFTRRQNVSVHNPSGRTLTVSHRGGLTPDEIAGLQSYANSRGVDLQIVSSLPPNHPSVVFVDSIPAIMGEAGVVASDVAAGGAEPELAAVCEL